MRALGTLAAASVLFLASLSVIAAAQAAETMRMPVGGRDQSFVSVAGGMGTLGSKPDEPGRKDDEVSHQQTVNGPFFVATTLVTRGQFKAFVADTGFRSEAEKGTSGGSGWDGTKLVQRKEFNWTHPGFAQTDDHPVVIVTLADARAFAAWAAQKTGKPMRLPKEYEFEFAARAGTSTPWYGATSTKEALALGWFKDNTQPVGTRPVGTRKPNPLGLYDTTGLVFEWCDTPYGPYGETEPSEGKYVLRGGSFLSGPAAGRAAARAARAPGSRDADTRTPRAGGAVARSDGRAAVLVARGDARGHRVWRSAHVAQRRDPQHPIQPRRLHDHLGQRSVGQDCHVFLFAPGPAQRGPSQNLR
jgi:formylglycine-generating enzyme required for sulfatase activity